MLVRRRPLMRAAVVGGAFAAGRGSGRQAEQRDQSYEEQNERISALEQQQAPAYQQPPPEYQQAAPAAAPAQAPITDQLNQLVALHQQGALTDAEFAAAKASLLGT